jgi:dTDP-glucose pyrophosphorylase
MTQRKGIILAGGSGSRLCPIMKGTSTAIPDGVDRSTRSRVSAA